jgi:prepilin-type processing-associated H-X9-DG protein
MDDTAKPRWRLRLVELVVVIGVLALLAALLVSWIPQSREAQRRRECGNNLRFIGLALLNYEQQNKTFPPAMICDDGEDPALTEILRPNWAILTLPFIEGTAPQPFVLAVPISDEKNRRWRGTPVAPFLCPADLANSRKTFFAGASKAEGDSWARGNYAVNAGNVFIGKDGGVVDAKSPQWQDNLRRGWNENLRRGVMAVNDATMDLAGIQDGTSTTILAGEIRAGLTDKDRRGVWAMGMAGSSIVCAHGSWGDDNGPNACYRWADDIKGGDQVKLGTAAEDQCMDAWGKSGSRQATFRSLHRDGCNVVFADCSVHFVSDAIETSGPWGDPGPDFWPVWDRLICSSDRHPVDAARAELKNDGRSIARKLVKVGGLVKFKDGMVPEGQYMFVTFHPVFEGFGSAEAPPRKGAGGEIGAGGRFEMTTIKPADGVLPGRYKVTIKCLKNYADPESLTIPKKYADFSTTPLEVTIDEARSDLVFELEK